MKRKKPLKRTPIKRTGSLKRTGGLKPRSAKTQKRYTEERIPFVKKILAERPWCEACPTWAEYDGLGTFSIRPSQDVHEVHSRGRTGGVHGEAWLDEANVLAVCRGCHNRITVNPATSQLLGLAK